MASTIDALDRFADNHWFLLLIMILVGGRLALAAIMLLLGRRG